MSRVRAGDTRIVRQGKEPLRRFTGLLFALFIVLLLLAAWAGSQVFRTLSAQGDAADDQRLSLTLLANDVRANDQVDAVGRAWVTADGASLELAQADEQTGRLSLPTASGAVQGSVLQGPALVLRETLESGTYETRIYRVDGVIMQEYAVADAPYDPEKAVAVAQSQTFEFSCSDNLLTIVTDAGQVDIALRSGGGDLA